MQAKFNPPRTKPISASFSIRPSIRSPKIWTANEFNRQELDGQKFGHRQNFSEQNSRNFFVEIVPPLVLRWHSSEMTVSVHRREESSRRIEFATHSLTLAQP